MLRDRTSVKASASVRIQFLHRVINFGCPYPLRAAILLYCVVHIILPIPFRVSASSPLENAGVGQPGPQDRIGIYDMRRSQKHERQSHEKRRNEDHDKILQNTAPVCGKAGIDLLDVGKKVRNPSAQTGERGSAENQLVCDHSGNGSVKRPGTTPRPGGNPLQPARTHSRDLPFSPRIAVKLPLDPCHQQFHNALLLILRPGRDTTYAGIHGSSRRRRAGR